MKNLIQKDGDFGKLEADVHVKNVHERTPLLLLTFAWHDENTPLLV